MSIESMFAGKMLNQQSDNNLLKGIEKLEKAILKQIEIAREPIVILRSSGANLSSNVADGVLILESAPTPQDRKIVVEDFNVNFTTAAGVVRVVILDSNSNVVNNLLRDVNSSTTGTGKTVLETGDRLAVVGQTAGNGTFGVYFSGYSQKVRGFD